jgi:hypothetical protein
MYRFHTGFFPMGIIYLWYGIDISLVWELYIDRFFMVLVVYKGSYISVSDRFLFKKRFYFDICIGLISIYYRHRCQTGEKAMEEKKSVTKRLFLKWSPFFDMNRLHFDNIEIVPISLKTCIYKSRNRNWKNRLQFDIYWLHTESARIEIESISNRFYSVFCADFSISTMFASLAMWQRFQHRHLI